MRWKFGTVAFALIAASASSCAYERSNDVTALRNQLAAFTADLNLAHDQVSALTNQLTELQKQVAQDQQQLSSAQQQVTNGSMQLMAASRPHLETCASLKSLED